jgi:hypothetical protein
LKLMTAWRRHENETSTNAQCAKEAFNTKKKGEKKARKSEIAY